MFFGDILYVIIWSETVRDIKTAPVNQLTIYVIYIKYKIFIVSAAVVYRVPLTWTQDKLPWKILHACLLLLALIFTIVGLCAVFDYHNTNNTPNLYSLHSWVGIFTSALFAAQVQNDPVLLLKDFSFQWNVCTLSNYVTMERLQQSGGL